MRGRLGRARDAARRAHHERLREPGRHARARERTEVAACDRPEVRVRGRRRRALVLAELRRDLVRGDDVRVREPAPQLVGDGALVRRVAVRMEQADGDSVGVDLGQRLEVERLELAVRRRSAPRTPKQRSSGTSGSGWAAHGR